MLPFAIPYPPEPKEGYWGLRTATIDWCEENYVVSHYIAEAVNTVTNSIFIILAAYAMYQSRKQDHELRFTFIAFGFMLVGVGSWLFHMTLLYQYQLLDELPMIYATCIPFWLVFSENVSKKRSAAVALSVFISASLLTAIYLYYRDPTIHQVSYAILNVGIIGRAAYLTKTRIADPAARKQLFTTMYMAVVIFLTGYFLWNMDIHFCGLWRLTRRSWGMPYGFVLEGHGWWHLLTGTGVYYYVVYLEYLRAHMLGRAQLYNFQWRFGIFPDIVLKQNKAKTT
ncbi:hypothetical protein BABINDRAFT_161521 [Babjeviella inositovora NRRL Y-12698]|uniref:Alkaline ceramidase n=1 Tax=Babjeviella inositovora NRRL Y-12698 TaxID=984486 RepID=A0A1E3QQ50_9ASCO|nr:uncharacterized protein BABINDRAFT_161521 [Babjeviella inositovora NRRL Y-12698]ODQ79836.1 hypothetical protein BABINDRAFT_161521 [Babjeviella inositovora NRRL Y-12698]